LIRPLKLKPAIRLLRVMFHLAEGLALCALVFPLVGASRRARVVASWSRRLLKICRVRVSQLGTPEAHALVAANHVSWLDIFVINSVAPSHFVAKAEIRTWPAVGWLAAKAGTIFIARGSRRDLRQTFQGIVDELRQGQRVAFFPEGTTAAQGTLLPFHANLFEACIDAEVALQPLALAYLDEGGQAHAGVDFTGEISFASSMLTILAGPPVHASLSWMAPLAGQGAHRRELSAAANLAIADALGVVFAGQSVEP
jgi:1-acyl-sn-glycerol-3-phosphate acyltransferase